MRGLAQVGKRQTTCPFYFLFAFLAAFEVGRAIKPFQVPNLDVLRACVACVAYKSNPKGCSAGC